MRPEYVTLAQAGDAGALAAQVLQTQDIGTYWLVSARILSGPSELIVRLRLPPEADAPLAGQAVWLGLVGPRTCYYAQDETLIANGVEP